MSCVPWSSRLDGLHRGLAVAALAGCTFQKIDIAKRTILRSCPFSAQLDKVDGAVLDGVNDRVFLAYRDGVTNKVIVMSLRQ
jgi:hypothetical protein